MGAGGTHDPGYPTAPAALRPGDAVAVVSPSGPADPDRVARGIALLTGWGLRVRLGAHAYTRGTGALDYLAGTDTRRLGDFNAALADPEVRGIVCTRGGYGSQRIVDALDLAAVRRDPKLIVGFSDITAVHLALWRGARLATVYGPGAAWSDERTPAASARSLRAALMSAATAVLRRDPGAETAGVRIPGTARGRLLGGNLCVLASSAGTPDLPDLTGAVLLLEDVAEPPYKIDRMLTQLRRAGALAGLAGVALGQLTGCGEPGVLREVLLDRLGDLGVPVLGGLPVGHGHGHLAVPLGVPATLDAGGGTLTVSPAVRAPADDERARNSTA